MAANVNGNDSGWRWHKIALRVADEFGATLGPVAFAVYYRLVIHADNATGICYPSKVTIAGAWGIGRRTVDRALNVLLAHRPALLVCERSRKSGRYWVNQYRLVDPFDGNPESEGIKGGADPLNLESSVRELNTERVKAPNWRVVNAPNMHTPRANLAHGDGSPRANLAHGDDGDGDDNGASASELEDLARALSDVCGMAWELNVGRLRSEAKLLSAAADPVPSADLVREHYGTGGWWWSGDWRGAKGDHPSPANIRETWGRWALPGPAGNGRGGNGRAAGSLDAYTVPAGYEHLIKH